MRWIKRLAVLLAVTIGAAGCGTTTEAAEEQLSGNSSTLEVHYLDVGQADCALLVSNGQYMVIDGGNNDDSETIVSYLRQQGVQTIEALVGTHPHEDHIGSLDTILQEFAVKAVYLPKVMHTSQTFEDVLDAVAAEGLQIQSPAPGETFSFAGLPVEVLAPQKQYEDFNNASLVLRVTAGEQKFLFTGDAEVKSEEDMLAAGEAVQADVLKVGHHGSETSTSDAFLQAVSPKYAVISVGKENKYGHPDQIVLDRLIRNGVSVYRTDEQGTVVCQTDGKTLRFTTAPAAEGETAQQTTAAEITYIGNQNSKKFHRDTCKSLPKAENQVVFSDRAEAIAAGYTPCSTCKP